MSTRQKKHTITPDSAKKIYTEAVARIKKEQKELCVHRANDIVDELLNQVEIFASAGEGKISKTYTYDSEVINIAISKLKDLGWYATSYWDFNNREHHVTISWSGKV